MLTSRIKYVSFVYGIHFLNISTLNALKLVNINRDQTVIFNGTLNLWLSSIFPVNERVENYYAHCEVNGSQKNLLKSKE